MEKRRAANGPLQEALFDQPIELRITESVAKKLALPTGLANSRGSFVVSQAGKTTREMIID